MAKQLFILAGQSNMAGRGGVRDKRWDGVVPLECRPRPSILRFSAASRWEEARDPLHADIGSSDKVDGVGLGMPFANALLPRLSGGDAVIGLVPCAVGGAAIRDWGRGFRLYEDMIRRAKEAVGGVAGGEIKAVLWYQGESDTRSDSAADVYGASLEKLINEVRSDLELPFLPFILVALASGDNQRIEKVREAQLGLEMPDVVCVDAKGLPLNADNLHLSTEAQVLLGKMLAYAYADNYLTSAAS